jgi:hypothetical protein
MDEKKLENEVDYKREGIIAKMMRSFQNHAYLGGIEELTFTFINDLGYDKELVYEAIRKSGYDPNNLSIKILDEKEEKLERARLQLVEAYENIIEGIDHYIVWDMDEIKLQALWAVSTYFYKQFPTFPYRFVTAMKSGAKTRLMNLTAAVAWNGLRSTSMSDSALFRSASSSTIFFDEAENINSKDKKSQRLILNSGYKRGGTVQLSEERKVDGKKTFVVQDYDVYGPKMLANINGMEDVLGSRCIFSILEKSIDPARTRLIEDFDTNPYFLNIKRTLTEFSVVWCSVQGGEKVLQKWNIYITNKYTTTHTTPHTYNYTKLHQGELTEKELELFNKIDSYELDGRHLELYMPLFLVANILGGDILDDILRIASRKVKEAKESDILESKDISLIEFVSKQDTKRSITYSPLGELTQEFKHFFESDETIEWLNAHWVGKALVRLGLITSKRRVSRGVEVILNIAKAKEKLKIFK